MGGGEDVKEETFQTGDPLLQITEHSKENVLKNNTPEHLQHAKMSAGGASPSALRWSLLARFISSRKSGEERLSLLRHSFQSGLQREISFLTKGLQTEKDLNKISRRPGGRFNVIQCSPVRIPEDESVVFSEQQANSSREMVTEYVLPTDPSVVLTLRQRKDAGIQLSDFVVSQKNDIDSTGLVCMWPAEEILTYYCISRPELFRNKRVIELGAGYGLAGLAIAACTEASEVALTDGNPQVVEYIDKNITANIELFGDTKVSSSTLHWSQRQAALPDSNFDLVIAADCTFFKNFHMDLAHTIRGLLGTTVGSKALLFNPRRGDSLDSFVKSSESLQIKVDIQEHYDSRIWDIHQGFLKHEPGRDWPNYDEDHCYPLLVSITVA